MATLEEAERIVRNLTNKYGYLGQEMMEDIEKWKPQYRREIDKQWLTMETALAHSIKTLAKEIYGSDARFVFELLQNADDNKFEGAKKANALPSVTFKMYSNHIIIECNEDGFTERDLEAICDVGKSTKTTSHGYIGAKGIGFKSVFIAAWKVHIQSKKFSFKFEHNKTDPGLGMVRPIWDPPQEELPEPLTRMTLHIHNEGDPDALEHLKKVICEQLEQLQQSCLLFLQNLQQITVEFYHDNGQLEKSNRFQKEKFDEYRVSLKTTSMKNGKETTQSQIYHITRQTASNITKSENRNLPNADNDRNISATAEVVLAFPLTEEFKPVDSEDAEKSHLFAFLPLKESNYKFHIHSDFDTEASRQNITTTSRRNLDLRDWIARAFIKAVLEFCQHQTLCYEWPRFLPTPANGSDTFWSGLDRAIQDLVKKTPLLRSRNRTDLRLIGDVVTLASDTRDGEGKPLLDDPAKDPFLSPHYSSRAIDDLEEYGLQNLDVQAFIGLLEIDLRSPDSKWYGPATSNEWHSIMAKLFIKWLDAEYSSAQKLKKLRLLPLRDGQWTSTCSGPVYMPTTQGIVIPEELAIRVLNGLTVTNPDRKTLFSYLGATEASVLEVRREIFKMFGPASRGMPLARHKAWLHYLYLTHRFKSHSQGEPTNVEVISTEKKGRYPQHSDIYLAGGDHRDSPDALLAPKNGAPGLSVTFLHSMYKSGIPEKPTADHPSWERWLYDYVGVRERLRLVSRDGQSLSKEFYYVFEHRKVDFLGLFQRLWVYESSRVLGSQTIIRTIRQLPARALCGVYFCFRLDCSLRLDDTWLPFQNLRESVSQYMEYPHQFPFLHFEESEKVDEHLNAKWTFLSKHFSVGRDNNLDFLLKILSCIERSCPKPSSVRQSQKACDLYVALYAKLTLARDQEADRQKLRKYFSKAGVLIPNVENPTWATSSDCLWFAPPDMVSKYSLKSLYSRTLGDEQLRNIEHLFSTTIGMPAASLADVKIELEQLRERGCEDFSRIQGLYRYLSELGVPTRNLRATFSSMPLIYAKKHGQPGWYKTSDCLWSSATAIRGKVTLDDHYEVLEQFFVDEIGVKSLTLQMVYDELRQGSQKDDIDEVKVTILSFNNFLQTEPAPLEPAPILEANIFPVRYPNGSRVLRSVGTDFAIGDTDYLRRRFEGKISLLDFDLEDVRRLKKFFEWAGLSKRYLSKSVKELTYVSEASGRPISSKNRDLKRKAYSLLRIAATFNSPRYQTDPSGLYRLLRTAKVIETDNISSVLRLSQNSQPPVEVEEEAGDEHISETSSEFTIYVPKRRRAQEICFGSALPRKLAMWLFQDPTTNIDSNDVDADVVNILTAVLACDRSVLEDILDRQGVIDVPYRNEDIGDVEDMDQVDNLGEQGEQQGYGEEQEPRQDLGDPSESDFDPRATPTHSPLSEGNSPVIETTRPAIQRVDEGEEVLPDASRSPRSPGPSDHLVLPHPQTTTPVPSRNVAVEDAQYRVLLNRVITAARRTTFPSRGAFDMSNLSDALPVGDEGAEFDSFDGLDVVTRFRSVNQLERDKKVGAAGELYVFELLSKLEMPAWSRANWKSNIRTYTRIHPEYADMAAWSRRETADLVYADTEGHLTDTLIGCGYLDQDEWQHARPTYYIEVKTTTGPHATPFYMSGNQYQLMRRIHNTGNHSEVYMILRVFWLNSDRIGMRAYFDPEQLRQDGQLLFTGQTWSVVPADDTESG